MRELGYVFDLQNITGLRFHGNVVIKSLTTTGILRGNVKYFELSNNSIPGNSYYVANGLVPALFLRNTDNAYGRISDNMIY